MWSIVRVGLFFAVTAVIVAANSESHAQCYISCPPGYRPTGSCCRTWYYDQDGNRICTSYGTYCREILGVFARSHSASCDAQETVAR